MTPDAGKFVAAVIRYVLSHNFKPKDLKSWLRALAFAMVGGGLSTLATALLDGTAGSLLEAAGRVHAINAFLAGAIVSGWMFLQNPDGPQNEKIPPQEDDDKPKDE